MFLRYLGTFVVCWTCSFLTLHDAEDETVSKYPLLEPRCGTVTKSMFSKFQENYCTQYDAYLRTEYFAVLLDGIALCSGTAQRCGTVGAMPCVNIQEIPSCFLL